MNTDFQSIYRQVALETGRRDREAALAPRPEFPVPTSFADGLRAEWAADNWFGREVSENWLGSSLNAKYVGAMADKSVLDAPFDVRKADFTGVENFVHELEGMSTQREFEIRKLNIIDRQNRQRESASRNGVMHQLVAHILDPTILIGAGVARAGLGAAPITVGARVAAVETGLVALTQGQMAARYDDRTAADAVRATAYAGVFSFVLGTGIAKAAHGRRGNVWGGATSGIAVRREASAARSTTLHIIDEAPAASPERVTRVDTIYQKPLSKVAEQVATYRTGLDKLAAKIGIGLDNVTDEALDALYQAGDKGQRQRITRFRKQYQKLNAAQKEHQLLDLERVLAHSAKDSDGWKSNAFAALMGGRRGLTSLMLPRVTATAAGRFETGLPGLSAEANAKIAQIYEGLRTGARKLTRSHGLDDAPGNTVGAPVESLHERQITQLYRTDEQLRTKAIAEISGAYFPHAMATPVVRNTVGVFRFFANKAAELPSVVTGGKIRPRGPLETAEDVLERMLQKVGDEAEVTPGGNLKLDHIEAPDAVKELYTWRSGEYQRIGKALREHNIQYVQRELDEQIRALTAKADELEESMSTMEVGLEPWRRAYDEHVDVLNRQMQLEEQADAYAAAIDPKYQPITLMAPKVRARKEAFVKAAAEHFRNNPGTQRRAAKHRLEGATQYQRTVEGPHYIEGRALALWHATVHRVDHAGRPVGRAEFMRTLEDALEEIHPGRAQVWRVHRDAVIDAKEKGLPVPSRPGPAKSVEEAAVDALDMRLEGLKRADKLGRSDTGGRYIQSEMFSTARLDPKLFREFIEDRPTIQFRAYLEREVRRVTAAQRMGDPDAMDPIIGVDNRFRELEAMGIEKNDLPKEMLDEINDKVEAYDLLRRQMMAEPLFDNTSAFLDNMNHAASIASSISTSADLGMAGYSVAIDLGQMLGYYGMGPVRLARLLKGVLKDPDMARAFADPVVRHQLGISGEIVRGARLRSIQGMDQSFGNQGGFLASGHYWSDMGKWVGNFYAEAASNIMNASLLSPITDLTQLLAAPLATTRVMQAIGRVATGAGQKIDANILRRLGIEPDDASRIWAQYLTGEKQLHFYGKGADELADEGVIILPKFSSWKDPQLAEQVMAMIGGDIRTATLHPGIAANRVWSGMGGALHAVSRLYYLFTRWAMVASANVYGKNIEDGTYQQIGTTMMYSTIIQAVVNYVKEPEWVTENITERLKNAFVMSGGLGYLGVMNERLERISGHTMGLRPMMGIDTFAHDPDSLQFRMASLGPVTGKAGALVTHAQEEQYGKLMRLFMPYQNWWLWSGTVRDATGVFNAEE